MGWNLPEQVRLQALSGCNRGETAEADAIVEQLKRTQSGSSRHMWVAAAEADANGEQQLKRINAIGEQQLKRTQSGSSSSDGGLSGAELHT